MYFQRDRLLIYIDALRNNFLVFMTNESRKPMRISPLMLQLDEKETFALFHSDRISYRFYVGIAECLGPFRDDNRYDADEATSSSETYLPCLWPTTYVCQAAYPSRDYDSLLKRGSTEYIPQGVSCLLVNPCSWCVYWIVNYCKSGTYVPYGKGDVP